ncbi:mannose-P-dolichol utilization defect 1 protein [Cylindrobasidium torrendii FP15055 ss-10]|uniref:Mannose-P-dolichol utilization defect 1 protein homolog n=1 Tax=Cylindrobasidium torrendii FP15055 ss-10 TaxID=1314674 RepID=A0A0D7AUU6_9AGAR|nr:mannose-P-dolichol utilization defect 1 protein [Cylindrobasidium torrendii FP15055 ss-10]
MTAITRNLPWFIKDLGTYIIGKECYGSLVEDLALTDVKCLKYSISKGLGIGIVLGGVVMKLPQLLLVLRARSARGLSLTAFSFETLAYAINLFYAFRNNFPFSTYGENLFLTFQNAWITSLIVHYSSRPRKSLYTAVGAMAISSFLLDVIPLPALAFLQLATLPISIFSKLPQIRQNYRAHSTGQLSAFAVVSQLVGCLARLFTTIQEVGDILVLSSFILALVLNGILSFQLWLYWDVDARKLDTELEKIPLPSSSRKRIRLTK